MKISITPAYRGQLVDLAYLDAAGKEKRFMRVLGAAPLEVNDDPSSSDGIPSTVADALVRKSKATIIEEPALVVEPAPAPTSQDTLTAQTSTLTAANTPTAAKRGKDK